MMNTSDDGGDDERRARYSEPIVPENEEILWEHPGEEQHIPVVDITVTNDVEDVPGQIELNVLDPVAEMQAVSTASNDDRGASKLKCMPLPTTNLH